jgi:hypothetical protein
MNTGPASVLLSLVNVVAHVLNCWQMTRWVLVKTYLKVWADHALGVSAAILVRLAALAGTRTIVRPLAE